MGERQTGAPLGVGFDSSVNIRFVGAQVSSDAGLLVYRELDERLGLTEIAAEELWTPRCGKNIRPVKSDSRQNAANSTGQNL